VSEFLAKHSIPVVPHPYFPPDLAPCDFFLFPRLKKTLKGKRLKDVVEIQLNTTRQFGRIAGIAAYNLKGRTLRDITLSNL
jgi:hypothetical protein